MQPTPQLEQKVTITMSEKGELSVVGNIKGPFLLGFLELAKASILKDLMGPQRNITKDDSIKNTGLDHEELEAKTPVVLPQTDVSDDGTVDRS